MGLDFHFADFAGLNRSETVDGLAKGVEHAAHDGFANGHGEDLAGTLDRIAFLDAGIRAEKGNTNVVFFEVQNHAHDAAGEFQQFHGHGVFHAIHAGDAVTDIENRAGFAHLDALVVVLDFIFDDFADFVCFDLHVLITPLERTPQDLQLCTQARIQDSIAHLKDDTAQDGRIHIKGEFQCCTGLCFDFPANGLLLGRSQGNGGR